MYRSPNESAVDARIERFPDTFAPKNQYPYCRSEESFGVIENQQASPIPALTEKLTKSREIHTRLGLSQAELCAKLSDPHYPLYKADISNFE